MRILYGVAGEGKGHATRSEVVIKYLQKKHEVIILASGSSYVYLSKHHNVHRVRGLALHYKKNKVDITKTAFCNLINIPSHLNDLFTLRFKADVVISDFESWSALYALLNKLPLLSLDNNHALTKTNVHIPFKEWLTKLVILLRVPFATTYLVVTFFPAKPKKKTILIPPLLREEVLAINVQEKKHVLVYQTAPTQLQQLIPLFFERKERFIVYGKKEGKKNNVIFKKEGIGFLEDLASAKAVITNGGFSLISESLHLEKPILCFPFARHYEQQLNARKIEELGYGLCAQVPSKAVLETFFSQLPTYKKKVRTYPKQQNEGLQKIDFWLKETAKSQRRHFRKAA